MRKIILISIVILLASLSLIPACRLVFDYTVVKSATLLSQRAKNISSFVGSYFQLGYLDEEVKSLKLQNANLESQIAQLKDIEREDKILRSEINLSSRWSDDYNLQYARVLGHTPKTYWQRIVVDKGSDSGVEKNNVVVYNGYLMGVVTEVYSKTCYVDLVSANQIYIPVVLEKSRGTGILRGGLDGLYMEEIPLEYKVEVGDMVTTQNFENQVVAGVPVGRVTHVVSKKGDIFQSAQLEIPVDFTSAEIVTIIGTK